MKKSALKPLGGQALMEGVMIKSPSHIAMAARRPDKKIVTRKVRYLSLTKKYGALGLPLIRGVIQLYEMLVAGISALTWSANQQGEDEELNAFEWVVTFGFAVLLTIGLFILLPYYLSKLFFDPSTILFGLIDGLFRLLVFIAYLLAIGIMGDVRRMFQYHGAEHMAVHCYEHRLPLTVKNVKKFPPEHPRCGTSLLFFVIAVSIVLFSLVRTDYWYINLSSRIILIPAIAGISYELLKFSAKYRALKWLTYPGIWIQKLTTKQPSGDQVEVAIAAVNKAK